MNPNSREVAEACLYIKEAMQYLDTLDDPHAVEALLVALELLTGEIVTHDDILEGNEDELR